MQVANIVVEIRADYDEDPRRLEEAIDRAAVRGLTSVDPVLSHFDGELKVCFGDVKDVWVRHPHWWPLPDDQASRHGEEAPRAIRAGEPLAVQR